MGTIYIRNWTKWQTMRKDRNGHPWIKLYRDILKDEAWLDLTDAEKGQIVSLLLLADAATGVLPSDDPIKLRKAAQLDQEPDLPRFFSLRFLVRQPNGNRLATERQPLVDREKRREEKSSCSTSKVSKTEKHTARKAGRTLSVGWIPNEDDLAWARAKSYPETFQCECTEAMKLWASANSNRKEGRKANWSSAWKSWLNREWPHWQRRNKTNGSTPHVSTAPKWAAVRADYEKTYGPDAFKRYNEDLEQGTVGKGLIRD